MHYFLTARRIAILATLLFLCLLGAQRPLHALTLPANAPNIYYSPWNWKISTGGTAVTNQPGAYFQFTCAGTQNVAVNLDLAGIAPLNFTNYMFVQWSIDGKLTEGIAVTTQSSQIVLGTGLSSGKHTVRFWFASSSLNYDRWTASAVLQDLSRAPAQSFRLKGITLDNGASLQPITGLQPRRIIFYGDSITEGYRVSPAHNAPNAYPTFCAAQLHAEFGVIGNAGQGWTINNTPAINVPLFPNGWNFYFANAPRFPLPATADPVDFILVNMGANDGLSGDALSIARHTLAAQSAVSTLTGIRAANPKSQIFLVVPFGGFYAQAMQNAVAQYQQAHPQDHGVFLVDLGWSAWVGITGLGVANANSFDGTHPNLATTKAIGYQLAAALQTALGQFDFLGTGRSDLILQNNTTGQIAFQSPLDSAIGAKSAVAAMPQAGFQVVGAADFNGDGKPDIVLQNRTTGVISVWYMNGTTMVGSGTVAQKSLAGWQVAGVADIDNDGNPDLILQNTTTRQVVIWYMNGLTVASTATLSDTPTAGYLIAGVGDINRDGKPDLILQNPASNQVVVWNLNGAQVSGRSILPLPVPAGYHIESVADYFGDGREDLVLRNSVGALLVWRPAEASCAIGTFTSPRVDAAWHIVGPH